MCIIDWVHVQCRWQQASHHFTEVQISMLTVFGQRLAHFDGSKGFNIYMLGASVGTFNCIVDNVKE